MLGISQINRIITPLWEQLPQKTLSISAKLGDFIFKSSIPSKYRIGMSVTVLTLGLLCLAKLIHRVYFSAPLARQGAPLPVPLAPAGVLQDAVPAPALAPAPPAVPIALPRDNGQYFNLLSADLQKKVGAYLDFETKNQVLNGSVTDSWQANLQIGLKQVSDEDEAAARKGLEAAGVSYYPQFTDSAFEHLRRYTALNAPNSRLMSDSKHVLKAERLFPDSPINLERNIFRFDDPPLPWIHGPLLVRKDPTRYVATHWPTGKTLWVQPNHNLPRHTLDLRTGAPLPVSDPNNQVFVCPSSLDQIEVVNPRRLFNHTRNQEINLNQDCRKILAYEEPYICFLSNQHEDVWIINGDIEINENLFNSEDTNFSFQAPYLWHNWAFFDVEQSGYRMYKFMKLGLTNPNLVFIQKEPHEKMDVAHYLSQDSNHVAHEVSYDLTHNTIIASKLLEFSLQSPVRQGSQFFDCNVSKNFAVSRSLKSWASHKISNEGHLIDPKGCRLLYIYNSYALIAANPINKDFQTFCSLYVIDLAKESISAQYA